MVGAGNTTQSYWSGTHTKTDKNFTHRHVKIISPCRTGRYRHTDGTGGQGSIAHGRETRHGRGGAHHQAILICTTRSGSVRNAKTRGGAAYACDSAQRNGGQSIDCATRSYGFFDCSWTSTSYVAAGCPTRTGCHAYINERIGHNSTAWG